MISPVAYQPLLKSVRECAEPISDLGGLNWGNGMLLRTTNWLGDALMTLPATWQLKRLLPEGKSLHVICPRFLAPLWQACPWVDEVVSMKSTRLSAQEIAQARALGDRVGMVFPNSFGSAWDLWRCGCRWRLGRRGRLRSLLLTDTLPEWPRACGHGDRHQLSWYLDLVSMLGTVDYDSRYPSLNISPEPAVRLGIHKEEDWLVLAPGAAYGPAKQWPAACFSEIGRRHLARGGKVVVIGSRKEQGVTAEVAAACPGALDLGGKTNLAELMSLLAAARHAVCNDSGSMHLAAACGLSGVGLFGSTDPVATGPVGAPWKLLIAETHCRPCFLRECPKMDQPYACLHSLTVDTVWETLCSL